MDGKVASGENSLLEGDSEQRHFYLLFDHASDELKVKRSLCRKLLSTALQRLRCVYAEKRPWQNENFKGINFNEVKYCWAYLKRYAGCHAALSRAVCFKVLEECPEFEEMFYGSQLHVLGLGSGPGNDLLGFCSAMNSIIDESTALQLTASDLYEGWAAAFEEVVQAVKSGNFGDVSKLLDRSCTTTLFTPCDLLSNSSRNIIETADIILMTKVLSSVAKEKKRAILQRIFSSMKMGAVFVYIDINANFVAQTAWRSDMAVLFRLSRNQFVAYPRCSTEGITKCTYEVCVLRKSSACYDVVDGVTRRLLAFEDDYDDDDGEEQGELEELEEIDQATGEDVDHDVPECKCDTEPANFDDILEYY